ncbi:MAG: dockerin type I repeat-containing protein, partial [Clostridia bacterium]|nr:dockerin type I repeat-containing protein [Clostridia bacterium]
MAKKLLALILATVMIFSTAVLLPASAAILRGDVDHDGKISSADARLALRGSVGLEELTADFIMRADVDRNGKVESSDARTILRTSVNLDTIDQDDHEHQVENWENVLQKDGSAASYDIGTCSICHKPVYEEHDYQLEVTKEPTCTEPGSATEVCTQCGLQRDTVEIPAEGHKEVTDAAVAATCTVDGKTEGSHCSVCGEVLKAQEPVKATGHKWDDGKVTTAATCTAEGVKTFTCTVCNETKTEAIPATGHTVVTDEAAAPTCTVDGKTEGSHCSVCGEVIKAQEPVKATGHKWDDGKVTTAAACNATGVKTYTCTVCKTTKTETIAKNASNHTGGTEIKNAKAATCAAAGYTGDTYCKGCGAKISSGAAIAKTTNHTWDSGKVTKAATCTATGIKTYTCTVCKTTKTETIAKNASNHTGGTEIKNAKAATCAAAGYTGDTYCKGCGAKISFGAAIAKTTNHTWDAGKVTTAATCAATGIKTYTCTVCKATKTETIAKTTNHTWDSGKVTKAATCNATGVKTYTCTVCKTTKTETIAKNASNHTGETEIKNAKAATCAAAGYTGDTYCKGCGAKISSGAAIAKTTNHTWDAGTVTKAATCAATGIKTYTCTVCKATKTETIAKTTNHTWDSGKVT